MKIKLYKHRFITGNVFGGNSSSSTTPVTNTATGGSTLATGTNATTSSPNSIAVGSGGKYNETGTTDLSGVQGNITIGANPADITALAETLTKNFSDTAGAITSSAASQNVASNQAFLDNISKLAMSQQTGGTSNVTTLFGWIAAGVLALFALMFYFTNQKKA